MKNNHDQIDIGAAIDVGGLGKFQIRTIMFCAGAAILDGFDTQMIGFLAPSISESFGLEVRAFAPVFVAGLVGLMVGALLLGPIADKIGRRWLVIVSTFAFGLCTFLTASATTIDEFIILRFLTGLGLGGAMPNLTALATEYSPRRYQAMIVAWLFAGIPVGAILGGLLSAWLLPIAGWQTVFHVGGVLPMLLAVVLVFALPESLRFLILKKASVQRVHGIADRIFPGRFPADQQFVSPQEAVKGVPVKHLFTDGRAVGTFLLWVPYFMNLLIIYFIISWMPAVLRQSGMPISAAIEAATAFSFGGAIGCLVTGKLIQHLATRTVTLVEFVCTILLIALLSIYSHDYWPVMMIAGVLGFTVQGAQAALNALVAGFYPTAIRSTGIGWALGIGRVGSIIGPLLGGFLLSMQWSASAIFLATIVPALVAAAAVAVMIARHRGSPEEAGDPSTVIAH
ncbi:MFS transporter [Brucella anthropi]|uniref:MFS transporter n=1 Tax=Brucella anthropi TaxID=529 RepID=A0A6I0D7A1_BRUAN|nr:MFS transporter [Brucella anthropi]KAB2764466.1 MFS transporter [Brucella anthropi]KAB2778236.1 MFS transporter [Brucella anthropi]